MAKAKKVTKKVADGARNVSNRARNMSTAQKVGVGIGLTAAAAAAAGAYFLYGSKNAATNRQKVRSWMLKAKAEALEQLEKAENMTKEEYMLMIDSIAGVYGKLKDTTKSDIDAFKREMRAHWPNIESVAKSAMKSAGKAGAATAAKEGARAAKKAAKKSPAKKAAKKSPAKKAPAKKSGNGTSSGGSSS